MVNSADVPLQIDLEQYKLHVNIPGGMALSLQFDTPSRRFYLSVMALVVDRMKQAGNGSFVPRKNPIKKPWNWGISGFRLPMAWAEK